MDKIEILVIMLIMSVLLYSSAVSVVMKFFSLRRL